MFQANITALSIQQPQLAQQIQAVGPSDKVVLFAANDQTVSMAYDNMALHHPDGPEAEAKQILQTLQSPNPPAARQIIIQFGLGLGYLLHEAFNQTQSLIIVFEPQLSILYQTLQVVDLAPMLASGRVLIAHTLADFYPLFDPIYLFGDDVQLIGLPGYAQLFPDLLGAVRDEVNSVMNSLNTNQMTVLEYQKESSRTALQNVPVSLQYPDIGFLENQFKGLPAVVVSAGPSLDNPGVLEALKANQEHLIIVSVGQAARALEKAGIVPDFIVIVEHKNVLSQICDVSYLNQTNLIVIPCTNAAIYALPTKRKIVAYPESSVVTKWLSKVLNQDFAGFEHEGTVSISAFRALIHMGCGPIFLLGQDLAFPDNKMYAQNAVYQNCRIEINPETGQKRIQMDNTEEFYKGEHLFPNVWEIEQYNMGGPVCQVKGWDGKPMYTYVTYNGFRKIFETIRTAYPNHLFVNCSEGGAYINGFEHLPFSEALKQYNVASFDTQTRLKAVLASQYHEASTSQNAYEILKQRYQSDRPELEALLSLTAEGVVHLQRSQRELNTKKSVTNSVLSYVKKFMQVQQQIQALTKKHVVLNDYLQNEMFVFTRDYSRTFPKNKMLEDYTVAELNHYLTGMSVLYPGIERSAYALIEILDGVFSFSEANAKPELSRVSV